LPEVASTLADEPVEPVPSVAFHGRARSGDWIFERGGIIFKSVLVALVLVVVKVLVHKADYEPIETLPLLTSLMGGVVFTLAILLAGTLQDFKEAERILGELVSQIRRLDRDLLLLSNDPKFAADARRHILALTEDIRKNLDGSRHWQGLVIRLAMDGLDTLIRNAHRQGASSSQVRTVQVWMSNADRIIDRLQIIIETTFARAGYYLAGTVVVVAFGSLLFTHLQPFGQGLFLFGFSVFLMVGLFLLIWDLDNPFAGHARINIQQVEELADLFRPEVAEPKAA
jgi:hypothetical protein